MPTSYSERPFNATLRSRVRGLVLGLALGDAVGADTSGSASGPLAAGAASQLAAWSIEATLRNLMRYGRLHPALTGIGLSSYQRWGSLRGLEPRTRENWHPFFELGDGTQPFPTRGWLVDEPAMANIRGSSPTTARALLSGSAVRSAGCQAFLRVLPVAAMALIQYNYYGGRLTEEEALLEAQEWARNLALLTHDDGQRQNAVVVATHVLVEALTATDELKWAIKRAAYDPIEPLHPVNADLNGALREGRMEPRIKQTLRRLAPDKTSWSALAGGIYVALSYPEADTIGEALDFAAYANDPDSVGAFAGAILGARHGYEALPQALLGRLELGWVMDRLACDLAAELVERQGGLAWKDDGFTAREPIDPWWDTKYPGV